MRTAQRLDNLQISIDKTVLLNSCQDKITAFGSCFAQNIYHILNTYGFDCFFERYVCAHYSTYSMSQTFERLAQQSPPDKSCLYCFDDALAGVLPYTYFFKNRVFGADPVASALKKVTDLDSKVYNRVTESDVIIVTLGTARILKMNDSGKVIVAATGIPKDRYSSSMTDVAGNVENLHTIYDSIVKIKGSSDFHMVLTLSPQRYQWPAEFLAGECPFVDNMLSKAILRTAIGEFKKNAGENVHYFPSFEIVIDELRNHETLSGYDFLHINQEYTPRHVVKRFLKAYAADAVLGQLAILDDLDLAMHQATKDKAHGSDLRSSHYKDSLTKLIDRATSVVGATDWNALLAEKLYAFSVQLGAPELFDTFWDTHESRLGDTVKSFMVWGTGGRYRQFFSPYVKRGKFSAEFLGFVDNNSDIAGTYVDGHLVHQPEVISSLAPDVILCASTYVADITKQVSTIAPGIPVMYYDFVSI